MAVSKIISKSSSSRIGASRVVKCFTSAINSVIEEGAKYKKAANPMKVSNQSRITYLQQALKQAVALNNKLRNAYRSFRNKLSGMIKITSNQESDLLSKKLAYGKADMNEDLLRSSLMDELHSQALHYNA